MVSAFDLSCERLAYGETVERHIHDYALLAFIGQGHARHMSELGNTRLGPGGVLLLGIGAWHAYAPQPQIGVSILRIGRPILEGALSWLADLDTIGPIFDAGAGTEGRVLTGQLDPFSMATVGPALSSLAQTSSARFSSPLFRIGKLCEILHGINDLWAGERLEPRQGVRVPHRRLRRESKKAVALMQSRLGTEISVPVIAREVGLSMSQLERVFAVDFGMSPTAYLIELRLTEFGRLLRDTSLTVRQAALAVGWKSASHAGNIFRQRTGLAPTQYRREHDQRAM